MPQIVFIHFDGRREITQGPVGDSVMDVALDNGVAGIIGQCGGGCTCVTCHCYIHQPWFDELPLPHPDETDMLEYAEPHQPNSRLACQVKLTDALDGMVVGLPEKQN